LVVQGGRADLVRREFAAALPLFFANHRTVHGAGAQP